MNILRSFQILSLYYYDALRRRMESYRRRQSDCQPRFDQTFGGLCEQNLQDTLALKQRFLETKAKRQNKTKQDKQNKTTLVQQQQAAAAAAAIVHQTDGPTSAALQSSVHVQQKFLKRGNEDLDGMGGNDSGGMEPPVKLQCTTQHNQQHTTSSHQTGSEGLTKFSVEIVQQLEFTTSAANSQPQQISTNVTVKALTNTSVKSDISSPKSNPSTPVNSQCQSSNTNLRTPNSNSNMGCDIGNLVECKQEPDNDFADLDQCAAALEKDAQANGGNSGFPGFSDLIGDDTSDEIITSDAFKDLISEISDLNPEFMKDFDFEEKYDVNSSNINSCLKMEDSKDLNLVNSQNNMLDVVKNTHSPMLQQNPYSPPVYEGQGGQINKNRLGYSNMDFVKTELSPAAQTLKQMAEQHQHKNQMNLSAFNSGGNVVGGRVPTARSPYGSGGQDFQFSNNEFSNSTNQNIHNKNFIPSADLIKQELNIFNNPTKGGGLPPTGPGMYKQSYSPYGSPSANHGSPGYMPGRGGGPGPGGPQGPGGPPPRPPSGANSNGNNSQNQTTLQINQAQQLHISQQSGHGIQVSAGQHLHLSGDLKGSVSIAAQQGMYFSQQNASQQQPNNQQQQAPVSSTNNTSQQPPNMHTSQQNQRHQQQKSAGGMPGGPNPGPNVGGPTQQHISAHQTQHMQQQGDTYTVSQSQTINFTQQNLRQRAAAQAAAAAAAAAAQNKGPNMGTMGGYPQQRHQGPVQMADGGMMHSQQMMHGGGMHNPGMGGIRPPPPDYKSAALMQGNSPAGYVPQNAAPIMRRITQQAMPPSGPMMRPQMMQQQYGMMGNGQLRPGSGQCNNVPNHMRMGGAADGNPDWRNVMMSQQNAYGANQMRGMMGNPNMPQMMNPMQQGGMGGVPGMQMSQGGMGGPAQMLSYNQPGMGGMHMNQMGGNPGMMNPNMMGHHQNMGRQNQMPITNINMSQQQSFSMSNLSNMPQNPSHLNPSNNQNNMPTNNQQSNQMSTFPHSAPDFNLDFLENLPAGDTNNFSAQELLNSLDSDPSFNIQDIL